MAQPTKILVAFRSELDHIIKELEIGLFLQSTPRLRQNLTTKRGEGAKIVTRFLYKFLVHLFFVCTLPSLPPPPPPPPIHTKLQPPQN